MNVVLDMDLNKPNDMLVPILSTCNLQRIHHKNASQTVRPCTMETYRHLLVNHETQVAIDVLDQMQMIEPNVVDDGILMKTMYACVMTVSISPLEEISFANSAQMNDLLAPKIPMIIASYAIVVTIYNHLLTPRQAVGRHARTGTTQVIQPISARSVPMNAIFDMVHSIQIDRTELKVITSINQ